MGAFLGVAQGAATSPWLLEMRYNYNPEDTPIVLVGKGDCSVLTVMCQYLLVGNEYMICQRKCWQVFEHNNEGCTDYFNSETRKYSRRTSC